jgi:hypothetical protein
VLPNPTADDRHSTANDTSYSFAFKADAPGGEGDVGQEPAPCRWARVARGWR